LRPNFVIILSVHSWKTLKRKKIQKRLQLNTDITLFSSAHTERKARTRESFMKEVRNEGRQACEGGNNHNPSPETAEIITYTKRTLKELSFSPHPKDGTTMTHHVWFLMQNHVPHNLPPTPSSQNEAAAAVSCSRHDCI
jgi:hypothetical protein